MEVAIKLAGMSADIFRHSRIKVNVAVAMIVADGEISEGVLQDGHYSRANFIDGNWWPDAEKIGDQVADDEHRNATRETGDDCTRNEWNGCCEPGAGQEDKKNTR